MSLNRFNAPVIAFAWALCARKMLKLNKVWNNWFSEISGYSINTISESYAILYKFYLRTYKKSKEKTSKPTLKNPESCIPNSARPQNPLIPNLNLSNIQNPLPLINSHRDPTNPKTTISKNRKLQFKKLKFSKIQKLPKLSLKLGKKSNYKDAQLSVRDITDRHNKSMLRSQSLQDVIKLNSARLYSTDLGHKIRDHSSSQFQK